MVASRTKRYLFMVQLRDESPRHSTVTGGAECTRKFRDPIWLTVPACNLFVGDRCKSPATDRASPKSHSHSFESAQSAQRTSFSPHGMNYNITALLIEPRYWNRTCTEQSSCDHLGMRRYGGIRNSSKQRRYFPRQGCKMRRELRRVPSRLLRQRDRSDDPLIVRDPIPASWTRWPLQSCHHQVRT